MNGNQIEVTLCYQLLRYSTVSLARKVSMFRWIMCPHLHGQAVMYRNKKCVKKFGLKFSNEETTWQARWMDESKVLIFVLKKLCMRVWSEFNRCRSKSNGRYLHSLNNQSFQHSYSFLRLHKIGHTFPSQPNGFPSMLQIWCWTQQLILYSNHWHEIWHAFLTSMLPPYMDTFDFIGCCGNQEFAAMFW
jgi:hypothetical protein